MVGFNSIECFEDFIESGSYSDINDEQDININDIFTKEFSTKEDKISAIDLLYKTKSSFRILTEEEHELLMN